MEFLKMRDSPRELSPCSTRLSSHHISLNLPQLLFLLKGTYSSLKLNRWSLENAAQLKNVFRLILFVGLLYLYTLLQRTVPSSDP